MNSKRVTSFFRMVILAAFLCLPICAMGQDSESLLSNDKVIETPPMYNKKHFASVDALAEYIAAERAK